MERLDIYNVERLDIYNAVREVPAEAKKEIPAGRLKGKTDINPMWRIKALTEQFGPCGFGWYYEITGQWLEHGHGDEVAAFCNINLYVNLRGEWSKPIAGTGGSAFVTMESKGLYTSDECYKMALTDAISVACKALGFGADVYWNADRTKYSPRPEPAAPRTRKAAAPAPAPALDPAPADDFDAEVEGAVAELRSARSRSELLEIDKRYRAVYGQYAQNPSQRYMAVLKEMCQRYPKTINQK